MRRALLRAVLVALLGALAAGVFVLLAYGRGTRLVVSMDTQPPAIVRGLYPVERDPAGVSFAWTGEAGSLALAGLDRTRRWTLVLRVKAGRGPELPLPDLTIDVDGVTRHTARIGNTPQEVRVELPTARGRQRGARVAWRIAPTFVPGPGDPRTLGVVVDEIRLEPPTRGFPIVPFDALAAATLAGAIFGAAFGLVGVTAGGGTLGMLALSLAQAAALTHGSAPYSAWLADLPGFALAIALVLVAGTLPWRSRLRNTAVFAAAFSAGALFLELLVLLHPDLPIGDALFQAHRFEWVLAGRWFFTSEAPGGYQFPYAIGLYVFSMPFATLVTGKAGLMLLLRLVVAVANAVAALLLYPVVARATGERMAAAVAVAACHLLPLAFGVQTTGNLTNAFGQAFFVATLALAMAGFARPRPATVAALAVVAATAMLSHTSTFAILAGVLASSVVLLAVAGGSEGRRLAWPIAMASAVAVAASVALYYAHFPDTYAEQYARISGELALPAAATDPGGRTMGDRLAFVPYAFRVYYGLPLLLLAGAGLVLRRWRPDAFSLILWSWLGACALFLALGIVTPIDLRHYLAAYPAVAILAGLGTAALWSRGTPGRVVAVLGLAGAVAVAVRGWYAVLA